MDRVVSWSVERRIPQVFFLLAPLKTRRSRPQVLGGMQRQRRLAGRFAVVSFSLYFFVRLGTFVSSVQDRQHPWLRVTCNTSREAFLIWSGTHHGHHSLH